VTGGVPKSGDGDEQGSILVETSLDESKAPFAVHEARVTTSGLGQWARKLTATVPLNQATLAGVALGVLFLVAIFALAGFDNDDPAIGSPTADAAGSDDSGSRGQFTDGGLFASEAPKKRSRASGAAGKEAALAERSDGQQALDGLPAGPTTSRGADFDQLGRPADDDDDEDGGGFNAGAIDPRNRTNAGGAAVDGTRSNRDSVTSTTVRANNPGRPLGPTTTLRPAIPTSPPTTGMTSASIPIVGQTSSFSPTTGVVTSSPPTSSGTSAPTQPSPTQPSPTEPATTTSTTNPPIDNTPLIAAPSSGSTYQPNARVTFAATAVAGADQYCWTFSGAGVGAFTRCSGGTTYTLSLGDHNFGFGSVAVVGEAKSGSTTLKSGSITINLRLGTVLSQPRDGETHVIGRTMRLGFRSVSGASQYCYRMQAPASDYDSGNVCLNVNGVTIGRNDSLWDSLKPGQLRISGWVLINGTTVGTQDVNVTLIG
jgi:hypothetical protein